MPSKKLITLLRLFSRYELSRFEKYLQSSYFNETKELALIYNLLLDKLIPLNKENSEDAILEKQQIWKQVYGTQLPYNDGQTRRLLSELTQHALHFLALEHLDKDPIKEQIILLDRLKDTNLDLHFSGVLRQAATLQTQSNLHNIDYHFFQQQIEDIQHRRIERIGHKIENLENLENADFHLNSYYITQKLKYYCDALEYGQSFSMEIEIDLFSNFFEWIKNDIYFRQTLIHAYFLIANMLLNPQEESFYYQLRKLLEQKEQNINFLELKAIYIHLVNYCVDKKINVGLVDFFVELFEIFKSSLDKAIWIENGYINPQYYKTIITVGLQVKEFAWTETFIQTYAPKLPPEERDNALTYNLAKVYFAQQRYEKVIEQLREVEYENLTYALGGKLMLLKTYYELNEYLALDSLIDSFRVYLRRNKLISKEVRQQYMNILRFIKKLSNVRPGDPTAVEKIEKQINECKNLADKGWIVSKVEELKG